MLSYEAKIETVNVMSKERRLSREIGQHLNSFRRRGRILYMLVANAGEFLNAVGDGLAWIDVGREGVFDLHSHAAQSDCGDLSDFFELWTKSCRFQIEGNEFGDAQQGVEVAAMGWVQWFHGIK